jgi:hypothetical protein
MFQADIKQWTGMSVFGPKIDATNRLTVQYRLKGSKTGPMTMPTGDFIDFGHCDFIGDRCDAPDLIAGQAIEVRVKLDNTTSSETPIMEGIGIHERLVPRFRRDYTMTANANDFIARRDGLATRASSVYVREFLEEAASMPANVTIMLPDERINDVALFSYQEHQVPHTQRGGLGWAITMEATQFTTISVVGIIRNLRGTIIGDLRGFTISQLRFM